MPQTEAQKRAVNKYQAAHYTIVGCKVRKEYAERFRVACYERGTTPAEVFKKTIATFLAEDIPAEDGSSAAEDDNL